MIAVVDYHKGNLKSVERGLALAGGDPCISDDAAVIAQASAIVLPGVGAFSDAITTMEELGLTKLLRDRILDGVPFLGICLGMHLMFEQGEEGSPDDAVTTCYQGLGILPGTVTRIPKTDSFGNVYKIPHVGWNTVNIFSEAFEEAPAMLSRSDSPELARTVHRTVRLVRNSLCEHHGERPR